MFWSVEDDRVYIPIAVLRASESTLPSALVSIIKSVQLYILYKYSLQYIRRRVVNDRYEIRRQNYKIAVFHLETRAAVTGHFA